MGPLLWGHNGVIVLLQGFRIRSPYQGTIEATFFNECVRNHELQCKALHEDTRKSQWRTCEDYRRDGQVWPQHGLYCSVFLIGSACCVGAVEYCKMGSRRL